MTDVQVVTLLMLSVGVLAAVAAAVRIAHPLVLVLGGLALGFVPGAPDVRLDPEVVFLIFLPPILYAAAFQLTAEDVRENLRPIGLLSVGLVLATVGAVAVAAHLVAGLDWGPAFVLGAVLGPTDPVAATAIIRRLGASPRIATILEGESLINDGTALVALRVAVGAVGASFSFPAAGLDFVWNVAAGTAIGVAAGWLGTFARSYADQPRIEITLGLVTTYGAFLAAELVGVSGILASVAAGLFVGYRSSEMGSPEARLQAHSFWDVVVFLIESALFVISGLAFQQVLGGLDGRSPTELAGEAAVIVAVVVLVRAVWMFAVPILFGVLDPRDAPARTTVRERTILAVASMRGAVTVAAALSVPLTAAGGAPFPDRDLVLFLAYATVVVTLVVPTLALPKVLARLGLVESEALRREAQDARMRIAHAALARAEELAGTDEYPEEALRRAREAYEMRILRAEGHVDGDGSGEDVATAYRALRHELVEAERSALSELRDGRELHGQALRDLERELDLEEARLRE